MARSTSQPMFLVTNAPGPFRLLKRMMVMLDEHSKLIVQLTVKPIDEGARWLGHNLEIKLNFEAALMGSTSKGGYSWEEPSNIRLLGKFLSPTNVGGQEGHDLAQWQWEVTFGSDRQGFVCKLNEPLSEEWTS